MARVSLYEYGEEARRLIQERRYDAAIAICRHILLRYPKHIRTYQILGEACLEKGELDEAADVFRRLLAHADPENLTAFAGLGVILEEKSQFVEAAWYTERAFELASSSDEIRNRLRRVYAKRDGVEPPRVKLNKAALARLYARGGQYRQAIDEFRSLLDAEPNRLDLKVALSDTLLRDGRREQALELALEILVACPDCLRAILLAAIVLLEKGKTQEAETMLAAGRGMDPENRIARGLFGDRSPLAVQSVFIPRLDDATFATTGATVVDAAPLAQAATSEVAEPAIEAPVEPAVVVQPASEIAGIVEPAAPVQAAEPVLEVQANEATIGVIAPPVPAESDVEMAMQAPLPQEVVEAVAPAVPEEAIVKLVAEVQSAQEVAGVVMAPGEPPAELLVDAEADVVLVAEEPSTLVITEAVVSLMPPEVPVEPIVQAELARAVEPVMEEGAPSAAVSSAAPENLAILGEAMGSSQDVPVPATEIAVSVPKAMVAEMAEMDASAAEPIDAAVTDAPAPVAEPPEVAGAGMLPAVAPIISPLADSQQAIDRYRSQLEEKPKDEESRLALARAYRDQEQMKLALEQYAVLLRGKPKLLAQLVEDMESLVASRPDNLEAHELLADMYGRSGQLQKAAERYRWILQRLEQRSN